MKTESIIRIFLHTFFVAFSAGTGHADSATWNLDPTNGADWNTATNWTPNRVPNGPADVATFGLSNLPTPTLSDPVLLSEIIFAPGASPFTITFGPGRGRNLNLYGTGITNDSGIAQVFALDRIGHLSAQIVFHNSATAGDGTVFNVESPYPLPGLFFLDSSSAGTSTIINNSTLDTSSAGDVNFTNNSTAAQATIINNGGLFGGGQGANTSLAGTNMTAGNATIIAHGGTVSDAGGGSVILNTGAHADDATLIADGGVAGARGGFILFYGVATGDRARVEVFDNGNLDISNHFAPGMAIGSIEGNGAVLLGAFNLGVGSNNLSTTFSGVIQDGGIFGGTGGSLTKAGMGRLDLTNANTYTGGTTINGGKLVVNNMSGSGTGSGPLQVNAGMLGGRGTIAGAVTVGTGSGGGAVLAPGRSRGEADTLTIQSALTFNSDATHRFELKTRRVIADKVVANGVTINGAQFSFLSYGNSTLATGTIFIVINNTSATPISGTFVNLSDGAKVTVGSNTFQADYEGGDGNDLTLTVVP